MRIIKIKEIKKDGVSSKQYITDTPFCIDSIISLLRGYENENTKLFECMCVTFSESGNSWCPKYRNIDALVELYDFPNPSIGINAIFVDPRDMSYKFQIGTAANTNSFSYTVLERASHYVKRQLELD